MKKRSLFVAVLLSLFIVGLSGCVTAKFSEPITSFQQGINKSSVIVTNYYKRTNDFERDLYLNDCLFNPGKKLLVYENGKPTPLLHVTLSPESIKARADALFLIGIYANRLGELVGNKSPEVFRQHAVKLGKNLHNLGKTFAALSKNDINARHYSGPISKIIGLLGEKYLEKSRDQMIELAIKDGHPAVDKILNQLQNDMNDVIVPLQKTGLRQEISEISVYYNEHRSKLSFSGRKTQLSRIDKIVKGYDKLINSNPANLIQQMKQANDALVKYAKSSQTPKDLAEFVSVLDRFNNEVKIFATK